MDDLTKLDCKSHGCIFASSNSGQRTNGPCTCIPESRSGMQLMIKMLAHERRMTPPTVAGDIGELLETVAMMPGCCSSTTDRVGFSRTIDSLRTAVASLQDEIKAVEQRADHVYDQNTTLKGLIAWAIPKICDECGCDNVNRTLCPITNPDCPAVRARAELEVA